MTLDETAARLAMPGTAVVELGERTWTWGPLEARYLVYSLTKPVLAAAVLRQVGAEAQAVRASPGRPWSDEEILRRAREAGPTDAPGEGWAYSNTGYLLLRRLLEAHGGLDAALHGLNLGRATVAHALADLQPTPPAPSRWLHDGVDDVRGVYHPHWVGHRTLVATVGDLLGFWRALPAAMREPATFVEIGREVPGMVRPSYGLGLMADPGAPEGVVVGHGGGGPGYAAGAFTVPAAGAVAIVLTADEAYPAPDAARSLLRAALDG